MPLQFSITCSDPTLYYRMLWENHLTFSKPHFLTYEMVRTVIGRHIVRIRNNLCKLSIRSPNKETCGHICFMLKLQARNKKQKQTHENHKKIKMIFCIFLKIPKTNFKWYFNSFIVNYNTYTEKYTKTNVPFNKFSWSTHECKHYTGQRNRKF